MINFDNGSTMMNLVINLLIIIKKREEEQCEGLEK